MTVPIQLRFQSARVRDQRTGLAAREPEPCDGRKYGGTRLGTQNGFTLVEVMVAVVVFCMVTLGVYTTLIESYRLASLSRARDEARAVLRTYVDQFERLQTTTEVNHLAKTRWLFTTTGGPTGQGLFWGVLNDANSDTTPLPVVANLPITLGAESHEIPATLTREAYYVSSTDGASGPLTTQHVDAAGYMLRGTFTINFALKGKNYSQSMSVLRVAP